MEAGPGVEPRYTALQTALAPLESRWNTLKLLETLILQGLSVDYKSFQSASERLKSTQEVTVLVPQNGVPREQIIG